MIFRLPYVSSYIIPNYIHKNRQSLKSNDSSCCATSINHRLWSPDTFSNRTSFSKRIEPKFSQHKGYKFHFRQIAHPLGSGGDGVGSWLFRDDQITAVYDSRLPLNPLLQPHPLLLLGNWHDPYHHPKAILALWAAHSDNKGGREVNLTPNFRNL